MRLGGGRFRICRRYTLFSVTSMKGSVQIPMLRSHVDLSSLPKFVPLILVDNGLWRRQLCGRSLSHYVGRSSQGSTSSIISHPAVSTIAEAGLRAGTLSLINTIPLLLDLLAEIDKPRFQLRGIRTQQLPGRQTKPTKYRVV
jgi:hypothetical protein